MGTGGELREFNGARRREGVLGPSQLVADWGHFVLFFAVLLGNLGLPVPEPSASSARWPAFCVKETSSASCSSAAPGGAHPPAGAGKFPDHVIP